MKSVRRKRHFLTLMWEYYPGHCDSGRFENGIFLSPKDVTMLKECLASCDRYFRNINCSNMTQEDKTLMLDIINKIERCE